jgi:Cu2+-containing amine oxidase
MASSKKPAKAAKPVKPQPKSTQKPPPRPAPKEASKVAVKPARSTPAPSSTQRRVDPELAADPALFDPLTPGEIADALRTLTEDRRLGSMAKVGRYRVICTEPLVVKPPHWMAGHRLARVVAFDYAADRTVEACVDLDAGVVAHLELTQAQPKLSRDEEALAVSIAMVDDRVREQLTMGDVAQGTLHYWGRSSEDLAFARRSAAVVFGRGDGHASVVAVVDLIENIVTQVVPAELW